MHIVALAPSDAFGFNGALRELDSLTVRRFALLALLAVLLTGCNDTVPSAGRKVTTPTGKVIGKLPTTSGPAGNAANGKTLYAANGCGACHTYTPAASTGKVGPDLDNLAAEAKKANRGPLDEFVKQSIVDPAAYIAPGFPNAMPPTFGQKLSAQQVADLVAFLTQGAKSS